MHPVLDNIISARLPIRDEIFRLWQQQLRDQIAPLVAAGEEALAQPKPVAVPVKAARA